MARRALFPHAGRTFAPPSGLPYPRAGSAAEAGMEDGADEKAAWPAAHDGVRGEGSATSHLRVLENPVLKVLEAVADAVTPAEVHEALVDRIGRAVGASSVGLWLVDAEGDTTTLVRSRGYA